jgi:hypothetical protein
MHKDCSPVKECVELCMRCWYNDILLIIQRIPNKSCESQFFSGLYPSWNCIIEASNLFIRTKIFTPKFAIICNPKGIGGWLSTCITVNSPRVIVVLNLNHSPYFLSASATRFVTHQFWSSNMKLSIALSSSIDNCIPCLRARG